MSCPLGVPDRLLRSFSGFLASIHRLNWGGFFGVCARERDLEVGCERAFAAAQLLCGLSGFLSGDRDWWLAGPLWCGDRVWAGQAAVAGGPQAASNRLAHSCWRYQPSGRWSVRWPRPWCAVRSARWMRSRRKVAPLAAAQSRLARRSHKTSRYRAGKNRRDHDQER
jgi:hypothetical protein